MPLPRKPKRLPGDNPLLRAAYDRRVVAIHKDYGRWLYDHGIDPETGRMNAAGLEFYKALLERQNLENRTKRDRRRRAA